jgi:hypothetical protein
MAFNAQAAVKEIDSQIQRLQNARNALVEISGSPVRTSGRGGARPGAGRPKGSGNKRGRPAGRNRHQNEGNGSNS